MRELFESLLAEGEVGIDRLVMERAQESVTLDFKQKVNATNGEIGKDDRKVFGKVLSAFSNSAGGLVIFGVEARKGLDDVDCAQSAKPIAEIERFEAEMRAASGTLLQPRHDGIEVRSIPSTRQPGAGYLLVRVERSDRRPHRAEAAGQKQYYKRAGDSSFEMEHYDIEDAFRRISSPDLEVEVDRGSYTLSGSTVVSDLIFYLRNQSSITAKFPYMHLICVQGITLSRDEFAYIVRGGADGWFTFSGLAEAVIHPGLRRPFARAVVQHSIKNNDLSSIASNKGEMFSFRMRWGCENSRMRQTSMLLRVGDYASPVPF